MLPMEPSENGRMMAAFYGKFEDKKDNVGTTIQYCQITGRQCSYIDIGGPTGFADCRQCNIPIVSALQMLGQASIQAKVF